MADVSAVPLQPYGQLLSAIPLANSDIATQQAQQGLIGQQTQAAQLANQRSAIQLGLFQQLMGGQGTGAQPGGAPAASAQPPAGAIGSTGATPDDIASHAFNSFAPVPTARPTALVQKAGLAAMAGVPEYGQNLLAQYDQSVATTNQQRQLGATSAYLAAQSVANAPAGAAWSVLNRQNPNAAAAIQQQYADDTPEQLDQDVRLYASHVGAAVHQYSNRPTDMQNGVLVDKVDGKPVLGTDQVLTGLSATDKQKAFEDANKLVTVPQGNGNPDLTVPQWKAMGAHSAESYVIAADQAARSSANAPASPQSGAGAPPLLSAATGSATSAPAPKQPASGSQAAAPVGAAPNPYADSDYKLAVPKVQPGVGSTPGQIDQQKATVAARTDLLKDSQDATSTAAQSLTYLNAAKAIMQSKGAPTVGLTGPLANEVSRVFGGVDATNYQEVAKYLGNAALQNAKATYGQRMTQSEVGLQLNELSPSTKMTPDAINNLIGTNIRNAQYTMDSAQRVNKYLGTGGDPQQFSEWNQKYWPQSKAVNGSSAAPSASAATMPTGAKLQAYATAHFGGDVGKASAFLSAQGYK